MLNRPYRSVLYLPGSNARALEKARNLPADGIIFDLEDAVSPDDKAAARQSLAEALLQGGFAPRAVLVRINALDTEWGADDLAAIAPTKPDAILLPKVGSATDIADLADRMSELSGYEETAIWAMIETPEGVLNALAIAQSARLEGFVMGTNDLAKDLNTRTRPALHGALQHALLAARAARIVCIDGVYNAFRDSDGLKVECMEGRDFGFDGKSLIHPSQIEVANTIFAPSSDEIDLAKRQIDAYEAALSSGSGVAVLDGRIVENLHVETARATLAQAEAIAQMSAA